MGYRRDLSSFPTRRSSDLRSAALSRNSRWRADANAALTVTADRQVIRAGKEEQRVVDGEGRITRMEGVIDELGSIGSDPDRKSTRLNSSHGYISYAVFC